MEQKLVHRQIKCLCLESGSCILSGSQVSGIEQLQILIC